MKNEMIIEKLTEQFKNFLTEEEKENGLISNMIGDRNTNELFSILLEYKEKDFNLDIIWA